MKNEMSQIILQECQNEERVDWLKLIKSILPHGFTSCWMPYFSDIHFCHLRRKNNQPAYFFNMVLVEYKNVPHKAPFLVLTVGQKSLFSPLNFFFTPHPFLFLILLCFVSSPSTYTIFLSSSVFFFFLLHSSHLSSPLSPPPPAPTQGQLVCVELTTRQLLHCLFSQSSCPLHNNTQPHLANQQPQ